MANSPQDEDILTPMAPRQDTSSQGDGAPQTHVPPPPPPRDRALKAKAATPSGKGLFSKKLHIMAAIFLLMVIALAFVAEAFIGGGSTNPAAVKAKAAKKKPLTVQKNSTAQNSAGLSSLLQKEKKAAQADRKRQASSPQNTTNQAGVTGLSTSARPAQSGQGRSLHFGAGVPGEQPQTAQSLQQLDAKKSQIDAAPLIALHGVAHKKTTSTTSNTPSDAEQQIARLKAQQRASYKAQSQSGMSPNALTKAATAATLAGSGQGRPASPSAAQSAWQKSAKGKSGYGTQIPTLPKLHKVALYPGTIIPAVTVSRLNTQTPGEAIAQVTRAVYSNNGVVAIPSGSRLVGKYDGHVFNGATRVMMSFTRAIFPDGKEIALGGMSGTGPRGAGGLHGNSHTHFLTDLGASLLVAMITTGVDSVPNPNSQASGNTFIGTSGTSPTQAGAQVLQQQAQSLLAPYSNIRPTITVPAGTSFRIMVKHTVMLPTGVH